MISPFVPAGLSATCCRNVVLVTLFFVLTATWHALLHSDSQSQRGHMRRSQNDGPLVVMDDSTASTIQRYKNGARIFGNYPLCFQPTPYTFVDGHAASPGQAEQVERAGKLPATSILTRLRCHELLSPGLPYCKLFGRYRWRLICNHMIYVHHIMSYH